MTKKTLSMMALATALLFSACGESSVIGTSSNSNEPKEIAAILTEEAGGTPAAPVEAEPGLEIEDTGGNSNEPEESIAILTEEAGGTPAAPVEAEPGLEIEIEGLEPFDSADFIIIYGCKIEGLEPFDPGIFNNYETAWETEHLDAYCFYLVQTHSQTDMQMSTATVVVDETPYKPTGVIRPRSENDLTEKELSWYLAPGVNWLYPFQFCYTISDFYEEINALWAEQRFEGSAFMIKYDSQLNYPTAIRINNIYNSGYDYFLQVTVEEFDRDLIDDKGRIRDPVAWGGGIIFDEVED